MNKMPTAKNNGGTSVKATGHDEFKPRLDYPKSLHSSCNILKTRGYWCNSYILESSPYKKGPKYIAKNYQPISLACNSCKLLNHSVVSQDKSVDIEVPHSSST